MPAVNFRGIQQFMPDVISHFGSTSYYGINKNTVKLANPLTVNLDRNMKNYVQN
jgi:hypothetical protein